VQFLLGRRDWCKADFELAAFDKLGAVQMRSFHARRIVIIRRAYQH
jgi:hypothetical protein